MPSAGYFHFYGLMGFLFMSNNWEVSMPSAGYFHFYPVDSYGNAGTNKLCQCPQRAIFISTQGKNKMKENKRNVSMPSAGYFHFYSEKDF